MRSVNPEPHTPPLVTGDQAADALLAAIRYHLHYHQRRASGAPAGPMRDCNQPNCRDAVAAARLGRLARVYGPALAEADAAIVAAAAEILQLRGTIAYQLDDQAEDIADHEGYLR